MKQVSFSKEVIGYIEIFVTGALWSTIGIFLKELIAIGCSVELATTLRFVFAFLVFAVITIGKFGFKSLLQVTRKEVLSYAVLAFFCSCVSSVAYTYSVVFNGVALSAVILNASPIFGAAASAIVYKEVIGTKKISIMALNIFGCVLAVTGGTLSLGGLTAGGLLVGVLAAVLYGITPVGTKLIGTRGNIFVFSTYNYFFTGIMLFIVLRPWKVESAFNMKVLVWSVGFTLVCTVISFLFYLDGMARIKASSKIPVIASDETIFAVIWGVFLYNEKLGFMNYVGVLVVIVSIVLMSMVGEKKEKSQS